SASACDIANIHAFYLGEAGEKRDPAASHRYTIQARQEKPDIRLEDCVQCEAMSLLRRVFRREYLIELADQRAHVVGYARHQLDGNFIGVAHHPSGEPGSGAGAEPVEPFDRGRSGALKAGAAARHCWVSLS